MTADPLSWRIEQYEAMGWSYASSVTLANETDDQGIPLYWGDVKKLLEESGRNFEVVMDILLGVPAPYVMEYEDAGPLASTGGIDDGA